MHRLPISYLIPVVKSLPPREQAALLESGGFSGADLYEADRKIDVELYDRLASLSAELARNPGVGLVQGSLVDLRQLGLVAFLLMNTGTLRRAFHEFRRYNSLVCSGISYELDQGEFSVFRFVNTVPGRRVPRVVRDAVLVSFLHLLRQLTDGPVLVRAAAVKGLEQPEPYRSVFGVVPSDGDDSLTLDAEVLDRRVAFADSTLFEHFRHRADALLAQGPDAVTSRRLEQLLARHWGEPLGVGEAAQALGLGVRTLQKHLSDEGTSFQAVLDRQRREWAQAELRRPDHSIGEIAWALGFSEQSVFQSAFKRWTGMTPLQYRKAPKEQG